MFKTFESLLFGHASYMKHLQLLLHSSLVLTVIWLIIVFGARIAQSGCDFLLFLHGM